MKQYRLNSIVLMLEEAARSAVQFITSGPDDYSQLGNSRIGGVPDLPSGVEWPKVEERYQVFVAQINLAELPRMVYSPLPSQGMMYFFHGDPAIQAPDIRNRVLLFSNNIPFLQRAEQPDRNLFDAEGDWVNYPPCRVEMKPIISLPYSRKVEDELYQAWKADPRIGSIDQYNQLVDDLQGFPKHRPRGVSQVFGYPADFADDPLNDAQLAREGKKIFGNEKPDADEVLKWLLHRDNSGSLRVTKIS